MAVARLALAVHRLAPAGHLPGQARDAPVRDAAQHRRRGRAGATAISFTPFIGLHLIGGLLLSFVVRGNYIACAVGTLIGNPATFFFIWPAS